MSRERVEFLDVPVLSLAPDPLTPGEVGSRSTFLSRDPDSGAQTRFVQVAPYWHWQPAEPLGNDLEILVFWKRWTLTGKYKSNLTFHRKPKMIPRSVGTFL